MNTSQKLSFIACHIKSSFSQLQRSVRCPSDINRAINGNYICLLSFGVRHQKHARRYRKKRKHKSKPPTGVDSNLSYQVFMCVAYVGKWKSSAGENLQLKSRVRVFEEKSIFNFRFQFPILWKEFSNFRFDSETRKQRKFSFLDSDSIPILTLVEIISWAFELSENIYVSKSELVWMIIFGEIP